MPSTASDLIRFEKMATGEFSGSWGTKTNVAMSRIEEAIAGYSVVTIAGSDRVLEDTLYVENAGTTAESHLAIIKVIGTPGATRNLEVPLRTKKYLVWNATTDSSDLTVGGTSGTKVTITNGHLAEVWCDGTNVEFAGPLVTTEGVLAAIVPVTTGGTGAATFTDGGVLLGSGTGALTAMAELGDGEMIVGDGTTDPVAESGATLRTSIGVGTGDSPTFTGIITSAGVELGHASDTTLSRTSAGLMAVEGVAVGLAGKQTIWMPSRGMTPTASSGCAPLANVETDTNHPDMNVLDFDNGSNEHAQFEILFPKSWDEGTITFRAAWTTTATDTDNVVWGLQGVAVGDGDTIDVAYGAAVTVSDACQSTAEQFYLTDESTAVTIAGTPLVDQLCYFRVFRSITGPYIAAEDARLLGVRIIFSTNVGNDD